MDVKIEIADRDMDRVVKAASHKAQLAFGESFVPAIAQVVQAELRNRGIESVSQHDSDFLARLALALAKQFSEYGYKPVIELFMGLGGHERLEKLRVEQPQRCAVLQEVVRGSGALSCLIKGLPTEYFERQLIVIVDAVSWQVDYDTNPRTAATRS
jgi:hypothetical protein